MALPRGDYRRSAFRSEGSEPAASLTSIGVLSKNGDGGYRDRINDGWVLIYVARGRGRCWHDDSRRPVEAGQVIQHLPGRRHGVMPDHGSRWLEGFVQLAPAFAADLERVGLLRRRPLVLDCGLDDERWHRLDELVRRRAAGREWEQAAVCGAVVQWIAELFVAHDRRQLRSDPIGRAIDEACRLLAEPASGEVDLATIAAECGLGYEHFRKAFRERLGLSPGSYRIRRRIDRARELMQTRSISITELAEQLGYPDPYTFSKQFKQQCGMSPSSFRQLHGVAGNPG